MTVDAAMLANTLSCPSCEGRVDVRSRHVAIVDHGVQIYCSAECLRARDDVPIEIDLPPESPPRRLLWWLAGGAVIGLSGLVMLARAGDAMPDNDVEIARYFPEPFALAAAPAIGPLAAPAVVATEVVDPRRDEDTALVAGLMKEAWIHPLEGPTRRMPRSHTGAFGAERPGERPPECVSGHCGVDLGRTWGEPVLAVHDGVVDFVNRGPNEDRGGIYVRIAHRDATLFSWYFHLAGVPRWIRAGAKVRAGEVIGALGDTGVKHSAPHLHFSISVKPSKHARERYLDPEPLIAIWPLWIPDNDNRSDGQVSHGAGPGLPVRAPSRRRTSTKVTASTPTISTAAAAPAAPEAPAIAESAEAAPAIAPPGPR